MSAEENGDKASRRGFFKAATLLMGGAIGAAMAVPVLRYLLHPIGRRVVSTPDTPLDVAAEAELVAGQPPRKVQLLASNVRDAWGVAESRPVGSAWLSRTERGEIRCFSATCPHLGCAIDYDEQAQVFRCPCHRSTFALDGEKQSGPSKRGLDPLPVSVEGGRVRVTFQQFRADVSQREPV